MEQTTQQQRLATFKVSRKRAVASRPSFKKRPQLVGKRALIALAAVGLNSVSPNIQTPNLAEPITTSERDQEFSKKAQAQKEIMYKQQMAAQRHQDRIHAQSFAMPPEMIPYTTDLNEDGQEIMQDMYEQELQNQGVDEILAQQYGSASRKSTNVVLKKQLDQMKKKATEAVVKEAKKAIQTAMKEGFKAGKDSLTKGMWSAFAQGGAIESEGLALESWFGSGTVATSYQAVVGALHNGKGFMSGYLSFLEPTVCKTPAAALNDPKSLIKPNGLFTTMYDAFVMMIYAPVSIMLLVAIIILLHVLLIAAIFPFAMINNGITTFLSFLGISV